MTPAADLGMWAALALLAIGMIAMAVELISQHRRIEALEPQARDARGAVFLPSEASPELLAALRAEIQRARQRSRRIVEFES